MRIILTQDVVKLGFLGDELEVKPGFARNYLIPQGKALPVTRANRKQVAHRRILLTKWREDAIEVSKSMARKLEEAEIVFSMKSGQNGKLFGSVTQKHIYEALEKLGIGLDRKKLHLPSPIKTLGLHTVDVKLHTEVNAALKIRVNSEEPESKEEDSVAANPAGSESAGETKDE